MVSLFGYQLVEKIHESSLSVVYRAIREADGNPVIIKTHSSPHPSPEAKARLKFEYELVSSLKLEGVIEALALEATSEGWALVFQDFGGRSLRSYLEESRLDLTQTLALMIEIAQALGRIHQKGVIHKDINPANLVWNRESGVVKFIDFGIATRLSHEMVSANANLEGSLPYLSPEQTGRMNRSLDYRTDYYSLGVTFYEMLTGRLPFVADDPMAFIHAHIALLPESPARWNLPEPVAKIAMKLIEKTAEARYQSMRGLVADVRSCLEQLEETGHIADFAIGASDRSDQFRIPEKLYGRESEIRVLLSGYEQSAYGSSVTLVTGISGIGKTALVQELYKPMSKDRGFFVSGKFDLLVRNAPYSAFLQVFSNLFQQLLGLDSEEIALWRARLLEAVGTNGALLIEAIPDAVLILGPQPPVPALPMLESEYRFKTMFENFVRALASKEYPLTLFVDDLQWADAASLNLLKLIALEPEHQYLYFIGAYRSQEVDELHPLTKTLKELKAGTGRVQLIQLSALGLADVLNLLVDALHADGSELEPLARLCYRKTGGNPFYLTQFLERLHDEGLIHFDDQEAVWRWDLVAASHLEASDDLGALMAARLGKLGEKTRELLRMASCFGNRFELGSLAGLLGAAKSDVLGDLWDALQLGLIQPHDSSWCLAKELESADVEFSFLHDRVQQAAYALFENETERKRMHLAIGRMLVREGVGEQLFVQVEQLNQAADLIEEPAEREQLARFNLIAGKRALDASAHQAASSFLKQGLGLLGETCWSSDYELTRSLYLLAATASHLCGEVELSEAYIQLLLNRARNFQDKLPVIELKLQGLYTQKRFGEAMATGLDALAQIGIRVPGEAGKLRVLSEVFKTLFALRGKSPEQLLELPLLQGDQVPAAMRILRSMSTATVQASPMLYVVLNCMMLRYSLKVGNSPQTALCYVHHGQLMGHLFANFELGYRYGRLAGKLLERCEDPTLKPMVRFFILALTDLWKTPFHSFVSLLDDFHEAQTHGDLESAGNLLMLHCTFKLLKGEPLQDVDREFRMGLQKAEQLQSGGLVDTFQLWHLYIRQLIGETSAEETEKEELEILKRLEREDTPLSFGMCLGIRHLRLGIFGDDSGTIETGARLKLFLLAGTITQANYAFYDGISQLKLLSQRVGVARLRTLMRVRNHISVLKKFADAGPENYRHRQWLLEAELARALGRDKWAMDLFDRAIAQAAQSRIASEEGFAHELAGHFHFEKGRLSLASHYITKAWLFYKSWGALAKVRQLENTFASLFRTTALPLRGEVSRGMRETVTTSTLTAATLDLGTVLKASQAISSELVLERLLERVILTLMENAGARRGLLLLPGAEGWFVVAEGKVEGTEIEALVLPNQPLNEARLPLSLVNYVIGTGKLLVLSNAAAEGNFKREAYIAETRMKSLLCMPFRNHARLAGILYLENELLPDVFTAEHCELLDLLSAQMAVSIENANFYNELEKKVEERTRELKERNEAVLRTQQQLMMQEKMASLGMLTAGLAHELKNPLNFVNNFSKVSTELIAEVRQSKADPDEWDAILAELEANMERIARHGKRADELVEGMMAFAHEGSSEWSATQIEPVVKEYANLAAKTFHTRHPDFEFGWALESVGEPSTIWVQPRNLSRVVIILVTNALEAVHEKRTKLGSSYRPEVRIAIRNEGEMTQIEVVDNGPGIAADRLKAIFDPFYTSKPTGQGNVGLGLTIAYDMIVLKHGGSLEVRSEPGGCTCFTVRLPNKQASSAG